MHGGRLFAVSEQTVSERPPALSAPPVFRIVPRSFDIEDVSPSDDMFTLIADATLACVLDRVCVRNASMAPSTSTSLQSPFDAVPPPKLPLTAYVDRILRYTKFSAMCFGVALHYLRRLFRLARDEYQGLTYANVHRLLVVAVHLASKASDDIHHANSFIALVAGVTSHEVSRLELEMCQLLDWRLAPNAEEVEAFRRALRDDPVALGSFWTGCFIPAVFIRRACDEGEH